MANGPPSLPPPAGKTPGKGSPWGVGCALAGGLAVILIIAVGVWVVLPGGKRFPLDRAVGRHTVAVVRLTDCRDDAGVQAMAQRLSELQVEAMRQAMETGPPSGASQRWNELIIRMNSGKRVKIERFPEAIGCVNLKPGDTNIVYAGIITLDMLPRLYRIPMKFALGQSVKSGSGMTYRDVDIGDLGGQAQVGFMGSAALGATEMSAVHGMIDRIEDGGVTNSILARADPGLADQWDVYGLVENRDGLFRHLVADLERGPLAAVGEVEAVEEESEEADGGEEEAGPPLWDAAWLDEIRSGLFGMDIESADAVHARLCLECADETAARSWQDRLNTVFEQARERLADVDREFLDFDFQSEVSGQTVDLRLRVIGLDVWMGERFLRLMADEETADDPDGSPGNGETPEHFEPGGE